MTEELTQAQTKIAYLTFSGALDQNSLTRLFNSFTGATQRGYQSIQLLFQSSGGVISDGISLYNFFRGYPLDIHIYNTGAVQSIAVPAYLGARYRSVSQLGTFLIHKAYFPAQAVANSSKLMALSELAAREDGRIESIIKTHCRVSDDTWAEHAINDVTFNAQEAVDFGVAQKIGEWSVPKGEQIFNV
jgi:ATP-dependent Clp protease, protease subunit